MIQKDSPLVTIQCLTYNHEPYIRQCLEGFVMQKTTFCFEAIVHDDASTDGTADIIREYAEKYPDIIKPIYETENQYSKNDGSLARIMNAATHGKYVAFCEGDDYWIDPLKLQRQVNVLESSSEIVMVYGNYETVDEHGQTIQRDRYEYLKKFSHSGDILPELMLMNFVLTCTTCFRRDVIVSDLYNMWPVKMDYSLFLTAAFMGKCYYMEQKISAYRKHQSSVTNSVATKSIITDYITDIHKYACAKFYELNLCRQRKFWINTKIKFNMIEFAIHLWYRNTDRTFLKHLLDMDKQLYCFVLLVAIKKVIKIMLVKFNFAHNYSQYD